MVNDEQYSTEKGLRWQVSFSIIGSIGWFIFLILWLFLYASDYSAYRNIAIILLSILVLGLCLGGPWAFWGMKHRKAHEKEMWKIKGFKIRVWFSGVVAFVFFIFIIYWLWFQTSHFDLYQNIAICLVSFLIMGGLMGASWTPWGMKHGHDFDKNE